MAQDGWETYSKLVLKQLETLSEGIDGLRDQFQDLKTQLTNLKAKEDRIQDIKIWKEKIEEITTPAQLKEALHEIEELKEFQTKAMTTFMIVQFIMASAMAILSFW